MDFEQKAREIICDGKHLSYDDLELQWNVDVDGLISSVATAIAAALKEGKANYQAELASMISVRTASDIPESKRYCSFCGQGDREIGLENLVEGPECCICGQCAENAADVVRFSVEEPK